MKKSFIVRKNSVYRMTVVAATLDVVRAKKMKIPPNVPRQPRPRAQRYPILKPQASKA